MRQTKYITSGGLAFFEMKDMEKLRRYSLKGWHVRGFKFMGYTLEKGESTDYIYSIDYRTLNEEEGEEYFDFFSDAGWSHVTSEGAIHLFRAYPVTQPIYTDRDTTVTKYERLSNTINRWAIPLVLVTALMWLGVVISASVLNTVLLTLATILTVLTIPSVWTLIASYNNKWAIEGKRRLVNLVRMLPFLLLFGAVMTLVLTNEPGLILSILASMVIGAIAFPMAIWLVMFLYYKVKHN